LFPAEPGLDTPKKKKKEKKRKRERKRKRKSLNRGSALPRAQPAPWVVF
jgi:hypothetical protein